MEIVKVLLASIGIPLLMAAVGAGIGTFLGWQLRSVKARREEVARSKAEEDTRRISQLRSTQNNAGGLIKNFLEREFSRTFAKVDGQIEDDSTYKIVVENTKTREFLVTIRLDALAHWQIKVNAEVPLSSIECYPVINHANVTKVCASVLEHLKPVLSR